MAGCLPRRSPRRSPFSLRSSMRQLRSNRKISQTPSYLPIHSIVKKGLVIERNAARRFSRSRSRRFATNGEIVAGNAQRFRCYSSSISNCNFTIGCKDVLPARLLEIHASGFLVHEFLVFHFVPSVFLVKKFTQQSFFFFFSLIYNIVN